jgi:hypothetical protein
MLHYLQMRQAALKFAQKNFESSVKLESNGHPITVETWPNAHSAAVNRKQGLMLDVVKV